MITIIIKNGNSIWFEFKQEKGDKIITREIPYAGNPGDLYDYLGLDDWFEFVEFIKNNIVQVPEKHIELKYCCKDCEEGEDGVTEYLYDKCRKCRCPQVVFIITHVKNKLKR